MTRVLITKDNGQRENFETGSRRDTREGKGRFDLFSPLADARLAGVFERGAAKYGDRNWEKGQPIMRYVDSLRRHLNQIVLGQTDEDHEGQMLWNAYALVHTIMAIDLGLLPADLDDRPCYRPDEQWEVA